MGRLLPTVRILFFGCLLKWAAAAEIQKRSIVKENACQVLGTKYTRTTRDIDLASNAGFLEEVFLSDNFQRECVEEVCTAEELLEAGKHNETATQHLVNRLCYKCESVPEKDSCVVANTRYCLNIYNGFQCQCKDGFSGRRCERRPRTKNGDNGDDVTTASGEIIVEKTDQIYEKCPNSDEKFCQARYSSSNFCVFLLQCIMNDQEVLSHYVPKKYLADEGNYLLCQKQCALARKEFLLSLEEGEGEHMCSQWLEFDNELSYYSLNRKEGAKLVLHGVIETFDEATGTGEKSKRYNFYNLESFECDYHYTAGGVTYERLGGMNNVRRSAFKVEEIYDPSKIGYQNKKKWKLLLFISHVCLAILIMAAFVYVLCNNRWLKDGNESEVHTAK